MASNILKSAARGIGKTSLDVPVAALAGLSVAFVAFAMPSDLLEGIVDGSGISSVLSAAQPPLGAKARIGISLVGGALAFGLVFLILRLIDRVPARAVEVEPEEDRAEAARRMERVSRREAPVEPEPEPLLAPKLRRWDAHPDAPSRRPIFAAQDFGEPIGEPKTEPAPFWQPDDFPDADPEEAERWLAEHDDMQPLAEPEPEPEPEPEDEPQPGPEPEPEPAPVAEAPVEPEPKLVPVEADPAPVPAAEAADVPETARAGETIAELMARLEQGLSKRKETGRNATPAAEPAPFPPAADDRLRSAIDNLQRIASRSL